VGWKYEWRKDRFTKVPYDPRSGRRADSTEPATWATFEEALAAYRGGGYAGIGYVFSFDDPFTGIDLDGCIDEAGTVVPAAREIVDALDSYSEVSPSGRGIKIIVRAKKPPGVGCKSKAITGYALSEVYDDARFFTVTGQRHPGTPATVEERQPQLDALCGRLWPPKPVRATVAAAAPGGFQGDDEALLAKAVAAKNGDRFAALMRGDISGHEGDRSGADLALCNRLAFWTGKDADRIDRIFRRSGLMRDKWDSPRRDSTYGRNTINLAIADCTETYSPRRRSPRTGDGASEGPDAPEADGVVPLGERDPASGRLVLSPRRTLPTAEAYVREFNQHDAGRTLHGYGGLMLEWRDNRYCQVEDEWLKNRLQPWLHEALRYVLNRKTGELELVAFESNPTTVKQALDTVRAYVHLPATTPSPSWLGGGADMPPALEVLPCKSHNLHIPTRRVIAPTPALFTMNALDFDYDPDPEPPHRWIKFLEQLWEDDLESVQLLQQWMGYSLTADTRQQKMLLIVGPKRSGKGTIGRVLTRLVGAANVAGPTTGSLAGPFGLQPLIDKSLAIVSDARFRGEHMATVVERLLSISGEDSLSIDRKFLPSVFMKLSTRFMFLTNELPQLHDVSAALPSRFLVLRLTRSFYDSENVNLLNELVEELPGILLWAIDGWKALQACGRFVQPASGGDSIRDMEDLASPVGAFVRERCDVGVGYRVRVDALYDAWKGWCVSGDRNAVTTPQQFGRDLSAIAHGVTRRRGTGMVSFYDGIKLKEANP
jgi:putative DNA primase/helicase